MGETFRLALVPVLLGVVLGSGGLTVRGLIHYELQATIFGKTEFLRPLKALGNHVSGCLYGVGQHMLVTGHGLTGKPKPMLLDEASLGLAPAKQKRYPRQ